MEQSRAAQLQVTFLLAAVSAITAQHSSSARCQHPAGVINVLLLQRIDNTSGISDSLCIYVYFDGKILKKLPCKVRYNINRSRSDYSQKRITFSVGCRVMSPRRNAFIFGGSGSVLIRALNWFPPIELRIEIRARSCSRRGCCRCRWR